MTHAVCFGSLGSSVVFVRDATPNGAFTLLAGELASSNSACLPHMACAGANGTGFGCTLNVGTVLTWRSDQQGGQRNGTDFTKAGCFTSILRALLNLPCAGRLHDCECVPRADRLVFQRRRRDRHSRQ